MTNANGPSEPTAAHWQLFCPCCAQPLVFRGTVAADDGTPVHRFACRQCGTFDYKEYPAAPGLADVSR